MEENKENILIDDNNKEDDVSFDFSNISLDNAFESRKEALDEYIDSQYKYFKGLSIKIHGKGKRKRKKHKK